MSIKRKLLISLIGISIIPIILLGVIFRLESKKDIESKFLSLFQRTITESGNHIAAQFETIEKALDEVMVHPHVQNNLYQFDTLDYYSQYLIAKDIRILLYSDTILNSNIDIFEILTNDDQFFYNYGFDTISENIRTHVKDESYEKGGTILYNSQLLEDEIIISRVINRHFTLKPVGYMVMTLPDSYFTQLFDGIISIDKDMVVMIFDENGVVLSSNDKSLRGQLYPDEEMIQKVKHKSERNFIVRYNNMTYVAAYTSVRDTDYYYVTLIPYDYINKEASILDNIIIALVILAVTFAVVVAVVLSQAIFKPINQMVDLMKKTRTSGDLSISFDYEKQDEIKYLTENFNQMMHRIQNLIVKLELEEQKKREAELSMLQAQINPHFLFNVLNSLKWTAMMSQSYSVAEGIDALANLLRDTINNNNEFITLEKEMENIEHYIVVQRIRYGESFKMLNQLPTDVQQLKIPKLLLQPIIENAIIHGFESLERIGEITVTHELVNHDVVLIIQDNGKGINHDQLEKIRRKEKNGLSSIGLSNVDERIKLHYGSHYGITIESGDYGTKVSIRLPYEG